MPRAGIIVIGNEVLSGKVEEANARYMITELRALGVDLERVVFIRDDVDIIAHDVRGMAAEFDHVFTTGGVGATHDDVTMVGVAKGLGLTIERHSRLVARIEAHDTDRLNDAVLAMADLPDGAELLGEDALIFPIVRVQNVFVLPGVPRFLRAKFEYLRASLQAVPPVLREIYVRVGEGHIADLLRATQNAHPGLEIGSYPVFGDEDFRVKITVEARDAALVDRAVDALLAGLDPEHVVRLGGSR